MNWLAYIIFALVVGSVLLWILSKILKQLPPVDTSQYGPVTEAERKQWAAEEAAEREQNDEVLNFWHREQGL